MGTVTKSDSGEKLVERIVVLTTVDQKARFVAMCGLRGINPSELVRGLIESDIAEFKAKKK